MRYMTTHRIVGVCDVITSRKRTIETILPTEEGI